MSERSGSALCLSPSPQLAGSAWAGPAARLLVRPRELRSHALLIPPGTCPSSRRLRASKEPINPPGARGSGSGSSSSPANEGARRGAAEPAAGWVSRAGALRPISRGVVSG